ncbi:MAG TPA: hemerythrin domain-containing protein [Candidatus Polarisedimenticolia bacterium]|nr:hemerythrin domain-containing protein [Candidatus Polarisedimenticolia bacterium]
MPARAKTTCETTDAISLLKQDHKKVKAMFKELMDAPDGAAEDIARRIENELKTHTEIEEKVFYPAFRDVAEKEEDRMLFFEATEEHHAVDLVLEDIRNAQAGSETFLAKAKVLQELVLHHIKEEEREMMPKARKLIPREQMKEIGQRIREMKMDLEERMSEEMAEVSRD